MGREPKVAEEEQHYCPYCDAEILEERLKESPLFCQACGVTIFYCPSCRKPFDRKKRVCPHCGTEIKAEKA